VSADTTAERLVAVHLLGFPLPVYNRAAEHMDGLMREFTLLTRRPGEVANPAVPRRLRELIDALGQQYAGFTDAANARRDEAQAEGLEAVDLTYQVPPSIGPAAAALGAMLDEADEFCREGDLLTLATPPEVLEFRRWYLSEFTNQVEGRPPVPWSDWTTGP
jgi:hypothetical protein